MLKVSQIQKVVKKVEKSAQKVQKGVVKTAKRLKIAVGMKAHCKEADYIISAITDEGVLYKEFINAKGERVTLNDRPKIMFPLLALSSPVETTRKGTSRTYVPDFRKNALKVKVVPPKSTPFDWVITFS